MTSTTKDDQVLAYLAERGGWVWRREVVEALGESAARRLPDLLRADRVELDWPGIPGTHAEYRIAR